MNQPSLRQKQIEETRAELVNAGRQLFGGAGYGQVTAQQIAEHARVTRGALYHHFPKGKPDLFEAVARTLQTELLVEMASATRGESDPWDAFRAALYAYFKFASDKAYGQITLQDAPSVLGAEHWRTIEYEYSLRFIGNGLESMMENGDLKTVPIETLASAVFGSCCELTLAIAAGDREDVTRTAAVDIIMAMLDGLRIK